MAYTIGQANEDAQYAQRISDMMDALETKKAGQAKTSNKPYNNPFTNPDSLYELITRGADILPAFDDLNDSGSVHNMDIEGVKNIWSARFGYGWVKDATTGEAMKEDARFWSQVYGRLYAAKFLDSTYYSEGGYDRQTAWKLKEDHGNS